jgi:hypothetical protein
MPVKGDCQFMDYISAKDAAVKWGITQRRVEVLCLNGQVYGAERIGNMWLIPKSADKPIDGRTKAAKQHKKPLEYAHTLEAERTIEMVNGTMAIENMPLSDDDRGRLRAIMHGEVTADEMVRQLVAKHRGNANVGHLRV